MQGTTGPNVAIFNNFKKKWIKIDKSKYEAGVEDTFIKNVLQNDCEEIVNFVIKAPEEYHPRDDYKEFLELSLLFLGVKRDTPIRPLGACHHARWMSKAIYALEIFLFRSQLKLSENEQISLRSICLFITKIYLKFWFQCPSAPRSPALDLELLINIAKYKTADSSVYEAVAKKFLNHLWYLSPETASLAFFDKTIPLDVMRKMVTN